MKVGFNLLVLGGFITDSHAEELARIRACGYDGVEVPIFDGDPSHYQRLGQRLDDLGLDRTFVTIIPNADCSPLNPDPAARGRAVDRLKWAVDCGAALGGTVMAGPYHSPLAEFSGEGPTETELAHAAEVHHTAADYAAAAGIRLALEPLNRFECYVLNTMQQAEDYVRRVDHANFCTMFDTFHANIEEPGLGTAIRRHTSAIDHVHIAENDRGIPGRGHVPWAEVFDALRAVNYDSWLTVEAFGRSVPELAAATRVWRPLFPDLETLYRESAAFIRENWETAGG